MNETRTRALVGLGYLLAAMLVVIPLAELAGNAFPATPTAPRWRYGFVGYLGNSLPLPVLGFAVAVFTAVVLEHRGVLRSLSVLGALGAVLFVGAAGMFVLDALQVRVGVNPQLSRSFDIATGKAGLSLGFATLVGAWTAFFGWRATSRRAEKAEGKKAVSKLMKTGGRPGKVVTAGKE